MVGGVTEHGVSGQLVLTLKREQEGDTIDGDDVTILQRHGEVDSHGLRLSASENDILMENTFELGVNTLLHDDDDDTLAIDVGVLTVGESEIESYAAGSNHGGSGSSHQSCVAVTEADSIESHIGGHAACIITDGCSLEEVGHQGITIVGFAACTQSGESTSRSDTRELTSQIDLCTLLELGGGTRICHGRLIVADDGLTLWALAANEISNTTREGNSRINFTHNV